MAKQIQKSQSVWARTPKFVFGAAIGTILGTIVVTTLNTGAYIILGGLAVIAAYTFLMTNPSLGRRFSALSHPLAPAPVLGALVVGVMAFAGAHYLDASFAWRPQGVINKTVQNVTTKGPVVDANTASAAVSVKPGDILNYTITISNIAPAASNQYNDMAYTVLSDTLPAGLELVSNPGQRTITENIGTLLPGKSVVKIYPVKVVSTSNNALIENKACFTADSVVRDNKQSGCDLAIIKVQVPVTPPAPTPTPPTPTPPTPTPPTPTPPTPTPTPPTPTPPTPTPPTPTPPTPTPPTPVTPPTPPTTTVSLPTQLPNVGPGNIITVALFAVLGGYVFHALYWYVKGGSRTAR